VSAVLELPIARLATSLAPLRGPRTDAASGLAPLPLRVAANSDGTYELLDGFKRLAHWRCDGHTHVPVVGRKNHYGSRSQRGTEVAALFYSLIESAKS
jgi:hypothetical protein